ncbi:MAG: TIGR01897 family CRISPR-associated protein [Aquificota bacterium]|nr:MAG: TIGR01897 family CRISPR-associated protein [Aquificota bacterium]
MEFRVNMDTTKILVAIWGNFSAWKDANYRYKNKIYTSSTTLPLLLDTIKPNYTYIILADTLMDKYDNIFTYQEGLARIKNEAGAFIKEKIRSYPTKLKEDNINILILPAVGTFSRSRFVGNPNNFYALVYFELARNILRNLGSKLAFISENNKPCLELYLDITHGLNFMTMMTYRAVKDILQIIAYFCKVRLIVLNSDPLVGSGNIDLNINEIEKINVIPAFNFYRYSDTMLLIPSPSGHEGVNALTKRMDRLYAFCSAFLHGLPVYMYYFYEKPKEDEIENIVKLFYDHIEVNVNGTFEVIQGLNFGESFISLLQGFLLSNLLMVNAKDDGVVKMDDIERIKGIFKHSRTILQRLERELGKIKRVRIGSEFKDYGFYAEANYSPNDNFDGRNFFAHCGFVHNLIELKREGNTIFIKPKQRFIEEIHEALLESLPSGG